MSCSARPSEGHMSLITRWLYLELRQLQKEIGTGDRQGAAATPAQSPRGGGAEGQGGPFGGLANPALDVALHCCAARGFSLDARSLTRYRVVVATVALDTACKLRLSLLDMIPCKHQK